MHSSVKIQRLKVNLMLHDIPQHDLIYSMNETAVYVSVLVVGIKGLHTVP